MRVNSSSVLFSTSALLNPVHRFLRNIELRDDLSVAERRLVLLSRRWMFLPDGGSRGLSHYDIDIFCQLEWLLRCLLDRNEHSCLLDRNEHSARSMPESTRNCLTDIWENLQPIADTCRCIYAACTFSATARFKYLSNPTPIYWEVGPIGHPILPFQLIGLDGLGRSSEVEPIGLRPPHLIRSWKQEPIGHQNWRSTLEPESMLDVMLEIAIFMRTRERYMFPRGKSSTLISKLRVLFSQGKSSLDDLSWHDLLPYLPHEDSISTQHVISISSKHIHMFSNVHIYGIVCFNILTENVPGSQKFKVLFKSISKFYDFVSKGRWKQVVHGKPEYLVRLVAWCWETDPSKQPAFSTICSLLQRAMRCLIFPPVLNLERLSNFLQRREYNLLHLYMSFVWSQDISLSLCDTSLMGELIEAFHFDTIEQQCFSSDVMCNKVVQAFAQINACKRDVEAMVSRHQNSKESAGASTQASCKEDDLDCNNRLIPSLTGEFELKSLIDMEKRFDSRSTEVLDFDVFEKHAVIFEALAYDSMLATFPLLDHQFWIRPLVNLIQHGQKLPIPRPDTLVEKVSIFGGEMNIHPIPQLVCFWEGI